jgi:serine-type D-Ala-D-Ala carboxypeptidase/endopeptidase (penicillin-binding protein 4)
MKHYFFLWVLAAIVCSCSPARFVQKSAKELVIDNKALATAHVGISVYSPDEKKYLYNYQGEKYFVPASNVKIATCYAAMKYLGDSLKGLEYEYMDDRLLLVQPTADPTFLHPDFKQQNVYEFLINNKGLQLTFTNPKWQAEVYGKGWAWDDYNDSYMPERSPFPVYGNVARFTHDGKQYVGTPGYFKVDHSLPAAHDVIITYDSINNYHQIKRARESNDFNIQESRQVNNSFTIPFVTNSALFALLKDTLHRNIFVDYSFHIDNKSKVIYSHPTDSVLKPMMHQSDNFFAEQTLLMMSNDVLGVMNDERIIDTLLKTEFKDLPQMPRWVDGSGLSRYNLFTPQDFVFILDKMKREFGMERIKEIFPAGNEGSLKNYYTLDSSFIYAKTGTLSGIVALSGYLYTRKNKLLVFSVLINNHQVSSTEVRRAVERFIHLLREKN